MVSRRIGAAALAGAIAGATLAGMVPRHADVVVATVPPAAPAPAPAVHSPALVPAATTGPPAHDVAAVIPPAVVVRAAEQVTPPPKQAATASAGLTRAPLRPVPAAPAPAGTTRPPAPPPPAQSPGLPAPVTSVVGTVSATVTDAVTGALKRLPPVPLVP